MKPLILIPHPALRPYIQNYLYFEAGADKQWIRADTSPTTLPVIAFALETDQLSYKEFGRHEPLVLCGQLTEYTQIHGYGRMKLFYVFLHPTGMYQLLGIPQNKLRNTLLDMSDLLGTAARILKDKLMEQTTVSGVRAVLETFFLQLLSKKKRNEAALRLACALNQLGLYSHQSNAIKRICYQQGYSISRLERHMKQMVGIGPKLFQRIVRFNRVLEYINGQEPPYHWARIARRFGYFDQTHFIKDFSWFYGMTPGKMETFPSKLQLSLNFNGEEDSGKSLFRVYE